LEVSDIGNVCVCVCVCKMNRDNGYNDKSLEVSDIENVRVRDIERMREGRESEKKDER